MTRYQLIEQIKEKRSFLCIGLDSDITKIPDFLLKLDDPVFEFNRQIIDATHDLCIAYKPNTAFYECNGSDGWITLEKTINYIKNKHPEVFVIADAKRGDIGNTSKLYAKTFFEKLNADAVTIVPYMGSDSVLPFFEYKNKWVIILALTSNKGAEDFQYFKNKQNITLYNQVIEVSKTWGDEENLMFVIGANKAEMLKEIRKILPKHFLLIPGIGAQGGSLKDVVANGINEDCGLIINSSRGIIFSGDNSINFANTSRTIAIEIQQEMQFYLKNEGIL